MSDNQDQQQVSNQISIQDLELSLEVYEIQSDQKLQKLKQLFQQKKTLDLRQVFYEERSSIQVKFQNIIGDLNEFLINQQVPSTEKLRKTFYRILQSPLLLLFKVSRFEIFNLRLNAFDIELQPIEAITELASLLYKNIDEYVKQQNTVNFEGNLNNSNNSVYASFQQFLFHAKINLISDELFILYSYLRKGSNILKKKVEDKIIIIEIFNNIESKLIQTLIKNQDVKTLKQISTLNYQIYLLQNNFDAVCFYLKVPFHAVYKEVFKELEILAEKAKLTRNYDMFIYIFIKFNHEIISKIQQEGIDQPFSSYIENGLYSLLELWGCRICHFREFFNLFKSLFYAYPNRKKVLELCLKYVPKLEKQDIALMRANYRQNIENKRNEFISLLKQQSLQEINSELNGLYHRALYNLNFAEYTREQIIELLTLVNGNSSIQQFFLTSQKAFKQWNHTIDFNNHHKFIQSQFKLTLDKSQTFESLRLFTNLCILEEKSFNKQFQILVGKGSINKILIGMIKFLLTKEDIIKLIQQNQIVLTFVQYAFKFLKKTLAVNHNQWETLLKNLTGLIKRLTVTQKRKNIQGQLTSFIIKNSQNLHLSKVVEIFSQISDCSSIQNDLVALVIDLFMKEAYQKTLEIKKFRFFGKQVKKLNKLQITPEETEFLKKFAHIQNGVIEVKQPSCLKLSQLEVITNPIHFEKAMDSYFFTLDSNSKRFVQYIAQKWSNSTTNKFFTILIKKLIQKYPVCIPILCNIRISPTQNSSDKQQYRFVESLVNEFSSSHNSQQNNEIKQILKEITECDQIKYRNGKDYVIGQIVPMILKRSLSLLNAKEPNKPDLSIDLFEVLSMSLSKMKLSEIKLDVIQKSILKINYEISISKCQKTISKLSSCAYQCMKVFFKKKEIEIKKSGLTQTFESIIWSEVRSYNPSSTGASKTIAQNVIINDHLMVSPYTLSQQYNLDEYKIKKSEITIDSLKVCSNAANLTNFQTILPSLSVQISSTNSYSSLHLNEKSSSMKTKQIDLTQMQYNIAYHLGKSCRQEIQNKQGLSIRQQFEQKNQNGSTNAENNEKSITFVQYYLRQMAYPQINDDIVIRTILSYLKNEINLTYLWTNPKNLEKIFELFVIIYDYITIQNNSNTKNIEQSFKNQNNIWKQIILCIHSNPTQTIKKILQAFSLFGYNNLWGENYKSLNLHANIKKLLQIRQIEEESFLSVVLKRSLEFNPISQIKDQLNVFLNSVFTTRPAEQTSLMYKVGIDKNLLNLIMKSLEIQNLNNISFLFHSNFNNLRLYTDQLHQGLKALNMASKTRSYNQYIQLAKQIDDEEFLAPMKLFQENFRFFIKIQKEGYNFKKSEQIKLAAERLVNVLRKYQPENKQQTCQQCDKIIVQYLQEIQKLQLNIANRVKSFYLVTKLRDLSYQNSISISLTREILKLKNISSSEILKQINKVDIFSLVLSLYKQLVLFGNDWLSEEKYQNYNTIDRNTLKNQITLCTTTRFSHSMNKIYQKCDLELDEIIQRCIDEMKLFFSTEEGNLYIEDNISLIYPPFLTKSFIPVQSKLKENLINNLRNSLETNLPNLKSVKLTLSTKNSLFTEFVSQVRILDKRSFLKKDLVQVQYQGKILRLEDLLFIVISQMINTQTLVYTKSKQSKFLTFNKYKTSEPTLQEIQTLGYLLGYAIYHKISLVNNQQQNLPLHSSIIAALSFNIADIDDVLDVDFKIWQDIKRISSIEDSKTLNLNFSYLFENIKTLEQERVELVDKGASKKVNNLNRVQFCDAIACYILYKNISLQINRLMQAVLSIVPKQLLSNLSVSEIHPLFYNKTNYESIVKKYMKKIGIVTPQIAFKNGERIENLKDYQNIQWSLEILFENEKFRQKIWKTQTNLFIVTTISGKGSVEYINNVLFIQHFQSKQQMLEGFRKI